jgi:hypothetical protein
MPFSGFQIEELNITQERKKSFSVIFAILLLTSTELVFIQM